MIRKECFTNEWISQVSESLKYPDVSLIEKVIRAFSLVELLADSGCPYIWKGGTALMLLLSKSLHRLSIDVDIICPPGTNIEDYLKNIGRFGFTGIETVERVQRETDIPKSHSKFYYQIAYTNGSTKPGHILLDVLYEDAHYRNIHSMPIESPFIKSDGEPLYVRVPSVEDILGDKLTAFAPNTAGIPYFKNGNNCFLEIIKQLYDVARLFDIVTDFTTIAESYRQIVVVELAYRHQNIDVTAVCEDTRQTALCISTRGLAGNGDFAALQDGINRIRSFMYMSRYNIEDAIVDASKAAYLVTLIEKNAKSFERFTGNLEGLKIKPILSNKLNKLKILKPEAFFYWSKTSEML